MRGDEAGVMILKSNPEKIRTQGSTPNLNGVCKLTTVIVEYGQLSLLGWIDFRFLYSLSSVFLLCHSRNCDHEIGACQS